MIGFFGGIYLNTDNNIWNNLERSLEWSCRTEHRIDMARHNTTTQNAHYTLQYSAIIIWIWTASNFLLASQSSHLQICVSRKYHFDWFYWNLACIGTAGRSSRPEAAIFTVYYWRDGTKTALQDRALGHTSLSCLATLRGGEVGVKHKQSDNIIHVWTMSPCTEHRL